ncbi:MAG TPA: CAP domain-containing protein [Myxococcaceae bacterium]|nr:CAP domain-containing protein [Myxococcaceae bacterium]
MILSAVAAAIAAVAPADAEAFAAEQVALRYERVGRRTPVRDKALAAAARELARRALDSSAKAVSELVPLTEAVSFAGGWDASPRAFVIKTRPAREVLFQLGQRSDFATDPASHVGIGAEVSGDASAVVILLADRRAALEPFPRKLPGPTSPRTLCALLDPPLASPEVLVTVPSGRVEHAAPSRRSGRRFCASIPFPAEGRYTVEILARGPRGPEVAALFFVEVGAAAARAPQPEAPEPFDAASARAEILERVNALRAAVGAPPVRSDPHLSAVAQAYSERMAAERFFAHVAPDGATLFHRLRAAGYAHRGAGENLGRAEGPLAAHFGIEHSPGHRLNVVDRRWSRLGIGVAAVVVDGRREVLLTEIFAQPASSGPDPLADAYAAVAEKRAELKLPALRRSRVLEELAGEHARRALALDEPKVDAVDSSLHERVFTALSDVGSAAVDFFIVDGPVPPTNTRALADARHGYVGIGAVKGDSPRFGRGHYWVVVIYAAMR